DIAKDRYDPLIIEGLLDPSVAIVRAHNPQTGERKLMTRQEQQQKQGAGWQVESTIKENGKLLHLSASKARELRVAKVTTSSREPSERYALYGFEAKDVRDAKPHWLDDFAAFLRRVEVSILLVLIGIGGLILELKVPGMTIPGITAAVCFVLFFWSQSQ